MPCSQGSSKPIRILYQDQLLPPKGRAVASPTSNFARCRKWPTKDAQHGRMNAGLTYQNVILSNDFNEHLLREIICHFAFGFMVRGGRGWRWRVAWFAWDAGGWAMLMISLILRKLREDTSCSVLTICLCIMICVVARWIQGSFSMIFDKLGIFQSTILNWSWRWLRAGTINARTFRLMSMQWGHGNKGCLRIAGQCWGKKGKFVSVELRGDRGAGFDGSGICRWTAKSKTGRTTVRGRLGSSWTRWKCPRNIQSAQPWSLWGYLKFCIQRTISN